MMLDRYDPKDSEAFDNAVQVALTEELRAALHRAEQRVRDARRPKLPMRPVSPRLQITEVDLSHCERCGGDHGRLVFRRLSSPLYNREFWAVCPELNEPVLVNLDIPGGSPKRSPKRLP